MLKFRKVWSYIVQLVAIVLVIYITFKKEITPKDVVNMVFWSFMYLVESLNQIRWFFESKENDDK